ncbi:MAG TPA: rRNA maturation RNase YbeY [Spirochaetia bacterium]|nr:rRNA maturation RNase YbeY [Spirochaetia bacterium]
MNDVEISLEGVEEKPWIEEVSAFALAALERLGKDNWDLSLLFCDDAFIQGLNRQYRDKDEPTDVLSFEQGDVYRGPDGKERVLAGDIVISLAGLARNVEEFRVPEAEELRRLVLHGILHLSGMDHEDNDPSRPMLALQEELLSSLRKAGGR